MDADLSKYYQNEIGGRPAGCLEWPHSKQKQYRFHSRQGYIPNDDYEPVIRDSNVTWCDYRRKVAHRKPKYLFYHYESSVTAHICEDDFFLAAMLLDEALPMGDVLLPQDGTTLKTNRLLMVFTTAGRATERQLHILFGLGEICGRIKGNELDAGSLLLPLQMTPETRGK